MDHPVAETTSRNIDVFLGQNVIADILNYLIQIGLIILICGFLYYLVHIGNQHVDENKRISITKKHLLFTFIGLTIILLLAFMLRARAVLLQLLSPFIFAFVFAYLLNPIVQYLNNKGISRLISVLLVYLGIAISIFIFSITLIPHIVEEIKDLIELLPKYSNESYDYLYNLYMKYAKNFERLPDELDAVKNLLTVNIGRFQNTIFNLLSRVTESLLSIFTKAVGLILVPIITFYFLKDKNKFKKGIILLIPKSCRKVTLTIARDIDQVLSNFVRGQLTVAVFIGVLTIVAMLILRVEFAVLIGIIAGIANVIPYFGPVIGIIPGVIFALMDGPLKALWVIITFTMIQQIESGIVAPKIVGKSVGLHPVFVMLSLILGGRFFGIIGLLIAVPTAAVIKVLFKHILKLIVKY
ncbi:AI-2E family transporter [Serpentinicella sp. ANB-PHB4]|uniref:AI-2E family transporter n=1 Tax=Serpentinicella sp. ANB-PHB4 TaxID=3074076 RepID=UPI0028636107|nr:AI-2E family transporter [Serpentinicella sp. ANB-PHB4]MDR5658101.1 AI-2E family transporter [Serpentinicella sp. ANB-PHB4]